MQIALWLSALVMGLATGPHCAVMCGPLCAGIRAGCARTRAAAEPVAGNLDRTGGRAGAWAGSVAEPGPGPVLAQPVMIVPAGQARVIDERSSPANLVPWVMPLWHLGRLIGYGIAGALAATVVGSVGWLADAMPAVRPFWVMLHAAVLAWGIVMLVRARPPQLGQAFNRFMTRRLSARARPAWWPFALGVSWAALPCGLLYSALMMAALGDSALSGAAAMVVFGVGSGLSLWAGPALWAWWRRRLARDGDRAAEAWGNRASGLLLVLVAGAVIWGDVAHRVIAWCR
ncbi:MAG: sulfite exporter TauE/SafE family protein [Burkholderiaceae bacterium]